MLDIRKWTQYSLFLDWFLVVFVLVWFLLLCFVVLGFVRFFPQVFEIRSFGASRAIYHKTSCRAETWDVQGKMNRLSSFLVCLFLQDFWGALTVTLTMCDYSEYDYWMLSTNFQAEDLETYWTYCVLLIKFLLGLMLASGEITVEYLSWTCLIPLDNPLYQHTVHSNAEHTSQQDIF